MAASQKANNNNTTTKHVPETRVTEARWYQLPKSMTKLPNAKDDLKRPVHVQVEIPVPAAWDHTMSFDRLEEFEAIWEALTLVGEPQSKGVTKEGYPRFVVARPGLSAILHLGIMQYLSLKATELMVEEGKKQMGKKDTRGRSKLVISEPEAIQDTAPDA